MLRADEVLMVMKNRVGYKLAFCYISSGFAFFFNTWLVVSNLKIANSREFIPKLFVWHLSRKIFKIKFHSFYCDDLDKCQTKSFGMSSLLMAIFWGKPTVCWKIEHSEELLKIWVFALRNPFLLISWAIR